MEIFDYQYFLIFSSFNNSVFLSERETADRNYALSYYMKENKCFPKGFNLQECLDFYFQVIKKSRQKSTLKSVPQFPYFLCVFCILHFSPFAQFRAICAKIQTIRIWIFTPKIISIFKSFPQFPISSFFFLLSIFRNICVFARNFKWFEFEFLRQKSILSKKWSAISAFSTLSSQYFILLAQFSSNFKWYICWFRNPDWHLPIFWHSRFFQTCSMEVNCETLAVMGASLANGGVCPTTADPALNPEAVRDVLSLMHSCGMYNYSGQFAFDVGLPAKSGVSGALVLVIPNVMGIGLWSPPLDSLGNTVRGVQFAKGLVRNFNFHRFDNLFKHGSKSDPRKFKNEHLRQATLSLLYSATAGDLTALKRWTILNTFYPILLSHFYPFLLGHFYPL